MGEASDSGGVGANPTFPVRVLGNVYQVGPTTAVGVTVTLGAGAAAAAIQIAPPGGALVVAARSTAAGVQTALFAIVPAGWSYKVNTANVVTLDFTVETTLG